MGDVVGLELENGHEVVLFLIDNVIGLTTAKSQMLVIPIGNLLRDAVWEGQTMVILG